MFRLTTAPLEQTKWMRVVYLSFKPSDRQMEPSVNSSSSLSRPSMIGPRLATPMLLTDTTSLRDPWGQTCKNAYYQTNIVPQCFHSILLRWNAHRVPLCKYLGIKIDDKLKYKTHIDTLIAKLQKKLAVCIEIELLLRAELIIIITVLISSCVAYTDLHWWVLYLADRCLAVTAWYSIDWPTYVDVILPQVYGVGEIHYLPVLAGGGARQAGGKGEKE